MKQYREGITTAGRVFRVDGDATLRTTLYQGDDSHITLITNSFDVVQSHVRNLLSPGEEVAWFEVSEVQMAPALATQPPIEITEEASFSAQGRLF